MTFDQWWDEKFPNNQTPYTEKITATVAWEAALEQCKLIIEDMDGCTDVQYCKTDAFEQLEKLK